MRSSHFLSTQMKAQGNRPGRKTFFSVAMAGLCLWLSGAESVRAQALQGPMPPEPMPTFELDKNGQKATLDFKINLHPISDPKLKFSLFDHNKLMVFYFSAQCPHCQHAAPHVQKLADELAPKGFKSIAVAINRNTEDDIRTFIRDFKIHMPVFHDNTREFGENYGTGTIPLVFVANPKGEYMRWKTFDAQQTPVQVLAEANILNQK